MDLMGPFEADLSNAVYELTVVEGKYGWIEVTGLKDKSAPITVDGLSRVVTDVMNNSNQNPTARGMYILFEAKLRARFPKVITPPNNIR